MRKCPYYRGVRNKRVIFFKKCLSLLFVAANKTVRIKRVSVERGSTVFQIVHVLTSLRTHKGAVKEINTLFKVLYDFLRDSKGDKIKRTEMINESDKGGLKMTDIQFKEVF